MTFSITTITDAAAAAELIERCSGPPRRVFLLGPPGPAPSAIARHVAARRVCPYVRAEAGCGVAGLLGAGGHVGHFEIARGGVLFAAEMQDWPFAQVTLLMNEAPRFAATVFVHMHACPCDSPTPGACECSGGQIAARFTLAHRLAAASFDELATVFLPDDELRQLEATMSAPVHRGGPTP